MLCFLQYQLRKMMTVIAPSKYRVTPPEALGHTYRAMVQLLQL